MIVIVATYVLMLMLPIIKSKSILPSIQHFDAPIDCWVIIIIQ